MTGKRLRIGCLTAALVFALLGLFALRTAFDSGPGTAEQEAALEKIRLLGSLRADWFHAGGTLTESEALKAGGRDSAVHLLFLGVDRRAAERGRADAIHLLRFEPGRLTLFSMPRDCLVTLRDDTRPEKLNHAYAYGGHSLMTRTIEDLLGIKIDGYLEVDLNTFVQMARVAKVVTLDGRLVGAEEIFAHIDGWLTWLRNRSLPGGDVRRVARQQLFIAKALDWTVSLYKEHPGVYVGALKGVLALVPTDITENQVVLLSQIYAEESDTPAGWNGFAKNGAIARLERFIMPGSAVMIDIRTGEEIAVDTATGAPLARARSAANADEERAAAPAGRTSYADSLLIRPLFGGSSESAAATPRSAAVPPAVFAGDTGFILSFFRIERPFPLAVHLKEWRGKGLHQNYADRDQLFQ